GAPPRLQVRCPQGCAVCVVVTWKVTCWPQWGSPSVEFSRTRATVVLPGAGFGLPPPPPPTPLAAAAGATATAVASAAVTASESAILRMAAPWLGGHERV